MDGKKRILEKGGMPVSNEVVMSYISASGRRDWGIYGERFFLYLVRLVQDEVNGLRFRDRGCGCDLRKVTPKLVGMEREGDYVLVPVPIRALAREGENVQYNYIRKSIGLLREGTLDWVEIREDEKGGIYLKVVKEKGIDVLRTTLVGGQKVRESDNCIIALVHISVWRSILDFTKGFRAVDMNVAWSLSTSRAVRFYELMSRQTGPVTYSVDQLRHMLTLENKYRRFQDFVRYVLEPVKKELDEKSPHSFTYRLNRSSEGRGRKAVSSVTLIPARKVRNDTLRSEKGFCEMYMVSKKVKHFMTVVYGCTPNEMKSVAGLLYKAENIMDRGSEDLLDFLEKLSGPASHSRNPLAYTAAAVGNRLRERYGYIYKLPDRLENRGYWRRR